MTARALAEALPKHGDLTADPLEAMVTDDYTEHGGDAATGVPTDTPIRELELTEDAARAH